MVNILWATRGYNWGFRFLLDGETADPLTVYEGAFRSAEYDRTLCRARGPHIALRFPDPEGRRDAAGRVIPHDFVITDWHGAEIATVEDGVAEIWPMVSAAYASVWKDERPPLAANIRAEVEDPR